MSRKIAFTSLGCDKNRVDSEVMLGILQKNGYTAVADEAEADIIVVNTCCFIKDALEDISIPLASCACLIFLYSSCTSGIYLRASATE